MSHGMTTATIVGNVGAIELKHIGTTDKLTLRIAVSCKRPAAGGEWREETDWFTAELWGARAVGVHKFLTKGAAVAISGDLRATNYNTKTGETRTATYIAARELVVLGGKGASREPAAAEDADDVPF